MRKFFRHNTSKVFLTFLISYIIVLMVPILIGSIAYYEAGTVLGNEITQSNHAMLKQLQQVVDSRLEEIDQLATQMSLNPDIRSFMYVTGTSDIDIEKYRVSQILAHFNSYRNVNRFIEDFYVYFPASDTVITSSSRYDSRSFYRNMYRYPGMDYGAWREEILTKQYFKKFLTRNAIPSTAEGNELVTYMHTIPVNWQGGTYANVAILLQKQKLVSLLDNIETAGEGSVCIIDKNNNVIASSGNELMLSPDLLEKIQAKEGMLFERISKRDMIFSSIFSRQNDWKYVIAVPKNVFMQKMDRIKNTTVLIVALCLIIGTAVACFMAYRNYNPLKKLINTMTNVLGGEKPFQVSDEYEFIQQTVISAIRKSEEVERQLQKQVPILRVDLLKKLLKGQIVNHHTLDASLRFCHIDFPGDGFVVVLVHVDDCSGFIGKDSEEEWILARFIIGNIIKELMEEQVFRASQVDLERDETAFIINFDGEAAESEVIAQIEDISRRAGDFLNEKFRIVISSFIGGVCRGLDGICASYLQASRAANYKLVKGYGAVISYSSVSNLSGSYYYPADVEMQMLHCVKAGDREQVMKLLERIFKENFERVDLPFRSVRCLFFDIMSTAVKILNDINLNYADIFGRDFDPVEELYSCESTGQMYEKMKDIFSTICTYIHSNKKSHNDDLKDRVIALIREEHPDANFCLTNIAGKFNISPAYLSYFFKEQTGQNISNFINVVRIEHAKERLKNSNDSLHHIARQVGYNSDIALIRAFKKYEGITPGKFREAAASQQ